MIIFGPLSFWRICYSFDVLLVLAHTLKNHLIVSTILTLLFIGSVLLPVQAGETRSSRCALSLTGRAALIGAALRRENILVIDPESGESKLTKLSRRDIWRILRLGLEAYPQFEEGSDSIFTFEGSNLAEIYLTHRLNQLHKELDGFLEELENIRSNPSELVDLLVSHEASIREWVLLSTTNQEQGRVMIEGILKFLGDLPQRTRARFHERVLDDHTRTEFFNSLEPLIGYYLFRVEAVRKFSHRIPNSVLANENFSQWRDRRSQEILAELEWIQLYNRGESFLIQRSNALNAKKDANGERDSDVKTPEEVANDFVDRFNQYRESYSLMTRYALAYPELRGLVVYMHDLLILARGDLDSSNERRVEVLNSLLRIYQNFIDSLNKAQANTSDIAP